MHLGDVGPGLGAAGDAEVLEAQVGQARVPLALTAEGGAGAGEALGIAALLDPGAAQIGEAGKEVDARLGVGVGARGVVDIDRRVFFRAALGLGRGLAHLTHGHPQVRTGTLDIDLARPGEGAGDSLRKAGSGADEILGNGAHDIRPRWPGAGSGAQSSRLSRLLLGRFARGIRFDQGAGGMQGERGWGRQWLTCRGKVGMGVSGPAFLRRHYPDQVPRVSLSATSGIGLPARCTPSRVIAPN